MSKKSIGLVAAILFTLIPVKRIRQVDLVYVKGENEND